MYFWYAQDPLNMQYLKHLHTPKLFHHLHHMITKMDVWHIHPALQVSDRCLFHFPFGIQFLSSELCLYLDLWNLQSVKNPSNFGPVSTPWYVLDHLLLTNMTCTKNRQSIANWKHHCRAMCCFTYCVCSSLTFMTINFTLTRYTLRWNGNHHPALL